MTNKKNLLFLAVILGGSLIGSASNILTSAQKASVLAKFQTEVKYNFVHLDALECDWDSLCSADFEAIVNTPDDYAFQREMERLCAQLHDGHTSFWINLTGQPSAERVKPLPFTTTRVAGHVYVTDVLSSVYADRGVDTGSEILKINGDPVNVYFADEVAPYLPSSTPQWTDWYGCNDFELTKGVGADTVTVTFRNKDGNVTDISSDRLIDWDLSPSQRPACIEHSTLPGNIGLLKIRSFNRGYFDVDSLASAFDKLENTDALIIDVRDNTGGNSFYGEILMRIICDDTIPSFKWSTPQYNAAFASWNRKSQPYVAETDPIPGLGLYDKPVVVLINNGSFSSTEDFVNLFKGSHRGVLFGEKTGGSTGNPIVVDLGFGAKARICTRNEWMVDGGIFIGKGISPDIEVILTPDFLYGGSDNVIEAALRHLRNNTCGQSGAMLRDFYKAYMQALEDDDVQALEVLKQTHMSQSLIAKLDRYVLDHNADGIIFAQDISRESLRSLKVEHIDNDLYSVEYRWNTDTSPVIVHVHACVNDGVLRILDIF
ncbi:MAG: S41 family peptidase [Odoribacter sp.]|nr:S41 family peptidase [Odoribacter sp.]